MGNKIGRRRQVVDDKYTRPQGLYQHRDIDQKKLRKLILEAKLAPCYIGSEECGLDLEECPICFLCFPSLNRSRCCTKGICTECFLQLKPPHATQPTQCPFCKTSNYAVEYRGVKTKEEKGMEEVEEQKVIEAQIRIRRQQIQDEADKLKKIKDTNLSATIGNPSETESYAIETNGFVSSQASCSVLAAVPPSHCRQNRPYNFDREVDDIMVMEAIWLSIQEHGYLGYPAYHGNFLPAPTFLEECYSSRGIIPEISPYGGLACAAAAIAERQLINFESGANLAGSSTSVFDALQRSGSLPAGNVRFVQNNPSGNWTDIPPDSDSGRQIVRQEIAECPTDPWSGMAVAGTGYAGSNIMVDPGNVTIPFLNCSTMSPRHFSPENFEEQMMLAMPLSLADSHARMPTQGLTWL